MADYVCLIKGKVALGPDDIRVINTQSTEGNSELPLEQKEELICPSQSQAPLRVERAE